MIRKISSYLGRWDYLFGMVKNAGWLTVERVIRLGAGFFIGIWVATYFGPDEYSVFAYGLSIVVIFRAVAGLGLRSIFVRQYVADPEHRLEYKGTSVALITMAGITGYIFAVLTSVILAGGLDTSTLVVAILAGQLLLYPTEVINYVFEAQVKSKHTVISRLAGYVVSLCVKVAIVLLGGTIVHLALAYLLDWLVVGLLYVYAAYRQKLGMRRWKWDRSIAKNLLRDSRYLILAAVMVTLYMQIDKPMLYNLFGKKENGLYSFAVQLAEAFNFIPVVIQQSAFPNIVASGKRNEQEYLGKVRKLMQILFYASIGIALSVTLVGDFVVSFLTSGKYADSGPMLKTVIWALPFVSSGLVQSVYLVSKNLLVYSLYLTAIGAVLNIGMNVYLIPMYGGVGAAMATVISYSVAGLWGGFLFPATRPFTRLVLRSIFFMPDKFVKSS